HTLNVYLNGVEAAGTTATVAVDGEFVESGGPAPTQTPTPAPSPTPTATPAKAVIDLNGATLDPATIDTSKPSITLEVTPQDGIAFVTIPATIFAGLEDKNAAFFIEIKAPYGGYQVPVNLASLIPGLHDFLAANNLKAEDISFKITLIDKSDDPTIQA